MLCFTSSYFVVEIVVGYLVNSLALIADSFHMLSDVLSMIVALYAIRIAKKERTGRMTFGWVRAEIIGAFANGVFLIALCFTLLIDAIQRFFNIEQISQPMFLFIVASVGFGVNLVGLFLFRDAHGHSHDQGDTKKDKQNKNKNDNSEVTDTPDEGAANKKEKNESKKAKNRGLNMRGVFLHILGDALGSVAVIIVGLVLWLKPDFWFGVYLDPILTVVIVGILLWGSIPLVKQSMAILAQQAPRDVDIDSLTKDLEAVPGVLSVHELHIWQLVESKYVGSCHVICQESLSLQEIATTIKNVFHEHKIHASTVQVEYAGQSSSERENACIVSCDDPSCKKKTCCEKTPLKERRVDNLEQI